jgi:hypothetical protein
MVAHLAHRETSESTRWTAARAGSGVFARTRAWILLDGRYSAENPTNELRRITAGTTTGLGGRPGPALIWLRRTLARVAAGLVGVGSSSPSSSSVPIPSRLPRLGAGHGVRSERTGPGDHDRASGRPNRCRIDGPSLGREKLPRPSPPAFPAWQLSRCSPQRHTAARCLHQVENFGRFHRFSDGGRSQNVSRPDITDIIGFPGKGWGSGPAGARGHGVRTGTSGSRPAKSAGLRVSTPASLT